MAYTPRKGGPARRFTPLQVEAIRKLVDMEGKAESARKLGINLVPLNQVYEGINAYEVEESKTGRYRNDPDDYTNIMRAIKKWDDDLYDRLEEELMNDDS